MTKVFAHLLRPFPLVLVGAVALLAACGPPPSPPPPGPPPPTRPARTAGTGERPWRGEGAFDTPARERHGYEKSGFARTPPEQPQAPTPPPSTPEPAPKGCFQFAGTVKGNDPGATADVELCRQDEAVEGRVTLRGKSGVSVRAIKGTWIRNELRLRDTGFRESRPQGGWKFCLIDDYTLTLDDGLGSLTGWYWSEDCQDRAEISLRRQSQ
jgi:hypothetical protein